MKQYDIIIIGGGAAGFFAAINVAYFNPKLKIVILERGSKVLSKVRVSGGGRCNVTHAEFDPKELTSNYPRGQKELLGPFHKFMTGDTVQWFTERGIELKIEEDGRMFPKSDTSQTIIDCFLNETEKHNINILRNTSLQQLSKLDDHWLVETNNESFLSQKVLVATGSNIKVWNILKELGHTIVNPIPSLFTFKIIDERIKDIPGVVTKNAKVKVLDSQLESEGPLLITHWGMSAPAILKLSAFGALELNERDYKFKIEVNFANDSYENVFTELKEIKQQQPKKYIYNSPHFDLPRRLWQKLLKSAYISKNICWADLNKDQLREFTIQLTKAVFKVDGKSTFKEEFVTAGGIDLKEINFKTFESKLHKNLFFAGEILNIDAITGGFNFQNAWTGAYIAAEALAKN